MISSLAPARLWRRLTIRTRLTLTYAALLLAGGSTLVATITVATYHDLHGPIPHGMEPGRLDPDHDRFIGATDEIRDTAASHLLRRALVLLVIVVVISALLAWWIAGRMLDRLTDITTAARRASDTTLHERINLTGPDDELKKLADTFDSMLERLDAAFAAQKRFVANAGHELRTPLAVTRTAVEVTLAKSRVSDTQWRAMAEDVQRSTERGQHLLEGLLLLARSQDRPYPQEQDDLADLAAEALDPLTPRIRERGLTLATHLRPAPVEGNIALLSRAVTNLLENAVNYNNDDGDLTIRTRTGNDRALLEIINDGPPIDPDETLLLLEPFYRGKHTRGRGTREGTGLGLSIVAAIADLHHGTLTIRARPTGGLHATLSLPTSR